MKTLTKLDPIPFKGNTIFLGADPELFLINTKTNEIIGSEKVIPEKDDNPYNKIVRDGVQVELNPNATQCREVLRYNIAACFKTLQKHINKRKSVKAHFGVTVKVSEKEMRSLNPENQVFGCKPSYNIYTRGKDKTSKIKVDPLNYFYRSAGGHIHLGRTGIHAKESELLKTPQRTVKMLDILVANTCVLIDRDPGNIERRKNYGKAGEYRTPPHGLEYRTLSNFWLRSYPLMSFVMGLTRFAIHVMASSTTKNNYEKAILDAVDIKDIRKAINTNNKALAMKNFRKIQKVLTKIAIPANNISIGNLEYTRMPLNSLNIKEFLYFTKKGLDHWFPNDPIKSWTSPKAMLEGWEKFLMRRVKPELEKELKEKACRSTTKENSTPQEKMSSCTQEAPTNQLKESSS